MENDAARIRDALSAIADVRTGLAERMASPRWFHPLLGVLTAQHVLVQGVDDRNWTLPSFLLLVGGATALVASARRSRGLLVACPRGPRSWAVMCLRVGVVFAGVWIAAVADDVTTTVLAAVAVVLATIWLGRRYDAALRRELDVSATRIRTPGDGRAR
ncbi:hypothetical protein [Pseudonocardia lacus]|uniref:hypothetical protein n=1 Tax=Pseudonocardia lacus TaxID=2835865 RepID=UPI001BDD476D|nr:hypothetical protein [Pseudonocardia lacus]